VFWFGNDYPKLSPIYERNAGVEGIGGLDTTYHPPPDGGWFTFLASSLTNTPDIATLSKFSQFQTYPWYITSVSTPSLLPLLGSRAERPEVNDPIGLMNLFAAALNPNPSFTPFKPFSTTPDADGDYGLLGSVGDRYYLNASVSSSGGAISFAGVKNVPFFTPVGQASRPAGLNDLDEDISRRLNEVLKSLAGLNKSVLFMDEPGDSDFSAFFAEAARVTSRVPYGAVFLEELGRGDMGVKMVLQVGTDKRISAAATYPTPGKRTMILLTSLSQSLARAFGSGSETITQGVRAFPEKRRNRVDVSFGGLIGRVLYPFGVSFLVPIFVITLVKEKEDRIWAYHLTHYITFYLLYTISAFIFLVAGVFSRLDMFVKTEMSILLAFFFVWGHEESVGFGLMIPYKLKMVKTGDEVYNTLTMLVLDFFLYLAMAMYLNEVVPTEFGVARPWHFPVTSVVELVRRGMGGKLGEGCGGDGGVFCFFNATFSTSGKRSETAPPPPPNETDLRFEDPDVKAERLRVQTHSYPSNSPIIINGIRKTYKGRLGLGPKSAIKDVTFAAEEGIILGLLGPNGAGKTTLISILTGVYGASEGVARLAGFEIGRESSEIYKVIGVCPQFDILWDDLTVAEHLYFYARLKGVPRKQEKASVRKSLESVSLTTLANRRTKGLSGGEKRRLSIAIALVGDPAVVFLDEPTTGLDPEVRRLIWSIVQKARKGKTIVLTTHSMEEAEALCQRIGIMAKGTLRCFANPLRLKELYGSGFRVFFNSREEDTWRACQWVESILPPGCKKIDAFATNTSYEFPPSNGIISSLFQQIEAGKSDHGILDWGISQTTLEEVFLRIISDDDANAD
ncbi:hypothetical protein HDU67_010287, partial [Dinochytrium kinnereticum]